MKKNNIFIISNTSWNLYNFRKELILELSKHYDIYLVCSKDLFSKKLLNYNIRIIDIDFKKSKFNLLKDIINIIFLIRKINILKPKYILTFTIKPNFYLSMLSSLMNIKIITNISGLGSLFLSKKFYFKILYKFYIHIITSRSYHIFFQNDYDRIYFNKSKKYMNNYSLIPGSGIDLKKYEYKKIPIDNTYFLFVGRLIKDKGVLELINAIKLIKYEYNRQDINFLIVGDYDYKNPSSIPKKIIEESIQENLFTHINFKSDIKKILINSNCVILPSYREGMSRVLIEALAIGRPIITSNVPGCLEMVKESWNGYLVEPKNEISLAEKIIKFHDLSYSSKLNFSNNSRKLSYFYDVLKVIDCYKEVIL